ncbi:bifunctional cobalt-precorrin-7 (C(5))-methyltransferase/cobalt-precorrin-6B (C(15))-methyltransferase [Asaia prunellae]|uniref:bifunctional cobalt-precorrin-7 (C(5))-methyltransferase/cobalt-precorrin-6B (C(15))-methyltransferase n=1 Tax=Asaia prunellae TaxID=610245 RepID=UPI00046FCE4A|nr:bifunctional cobalt-precorrin-7 (C(5))-methyltransferase/cobalt-precorrin-6B (C(15))-methyltransferase [Asaia prunellae]
MPSLASFSAPSPWLTVIGLGEDGFEALSRQAQRAINEAEFIMGGTRHLGLIEGHSAAVFQPWPSPYAQAMRALEPYRGKRVVVLASGDPFCFGAGTQLMAHFGRDALMVLPGRSCLTLACSRLGWSAQDISLVSLCGRPLSRLVPLIQPGGRLLVLSADETTPARLAAFLTERGCGQSVLHLLEALDGPGERICSSYACGGFREPVARLNMVAVEIVAGPDASILPLTSGLPDDFFEHDGQLTKREIRAVTLSALAPHPGQILWDLGAGSGSVSIEWMLHHPANRALAVERDPSRALRIMRNAHTLGVPELHVEQLVLPCDLSALPEPDAVFVGGGVGMEGMLEMGWSALKPGGRLVANAVTLEGEQRLFEAFQAWGGALSRIGIERLGSIGSVFGFRPAMTVTQYQAVRT